MYLKKKKILCACLSVLVGFWCVFGAVWSVSAESLSKKVLSDSNENIYVSDVFELLQAIDKVSEWGKIILKNDIDTLSLKLTINKSLVLDLNGYTITVGNESDGIVVENKIMINQKKIVKEYSDSYVWDENQHRVKQPFFGGDGYKLKVVDYESAEQYDDDICITIRNGKIVREAGKNGEVGIPDTWFKCSGGNGQTSNAPLILNSGNLYLSCMEIVGADGGDGGTGAHYAGTHLPINGGCGADGGNGGNGGSAVDILRKETKFIMDKDCKISSGKAGKAGKGGEASENYWFYKSKKGNDGKDGAVNPGICYKYKI